MKDMEKEREAQRTALTFGWEVKSRGRRETQTQTET